MFVDQKKCFLVLEFLRFCDFMQIQFVPLTPLYPFYSSNPHLNTFFTCCVPCKSVLGRGSQSRINPDQYVEYSYSSRRAAQARTDLWMSGKISNKSLNFENLANFLSIAEVFLHEITFCGRKYKVRGMQKGSPIFSALPSCIF